eukprot:TRINITY_DN6187_c0_g1_i1.p1 TRINITY_DN6187_c0_g1~~TRINITY_DN6187_c0_g1_i1.p1  ORF type:complete len:274 (+),score=22.09 TRINITY_DN6187_c0_g1_i1:216-1037(+)
MAVTHADLEIGRRNRDLGSKTGTVVIVFCDVCGILGFVLCMLAESTRTKVSWVKMVSEEGRERFNCVYNRNGETSLLCAVGAFLTLAISVVIQHVYMWLAVKNRQQSSVGSPPQTIWDARYSSKANLLGKQLAFLLLSTWVCFAVAEVLLVIGMTVESTHLRRWRHARRDCLVTRHGAFLAAGVFDLSTVILATAFFCVLLRMKRAIGEADVHREVMHVDLYPSTSLPDSSPALTRNSNLMENSASAGNDPRVRDGDGSLLKGFQSDREREPT